jgi:hypothetical protein
MKRSLGPTRTIDGGFEQAARHVVLPIRPAEEPIGAQHTYPAIRSTPAASPPRKNIWLLMSNLIDCPGS